MKNKNTKEGAKGNHQMLRFRMAVLNVKGINQPAKRRIIEEWAEHKGVGIMLLTETQHAHSSQEGTDRIECERVIEQHWKWYFGTGVDAHMHDDISKKRKMGMKPTIEERSRAKEHAGVACVINKSLWSKIKDVRPMGGRAMTCKLRMSRNINIVVAYAPHAEKSDEEKDAFYNTLYTYTAGFKKHEINIVAGDFNAILVRPLTEEEKRHIGPFGLGRNCKRVEEFNEKVATGQGC